MPPEVIAILVAALYIGYCIGSRTDRVLARMDDASARLGAIEELVGRIPGVENYREPDVHEWASARERNPDAKLGNRRNWNKATS